MLAHEQIISLQEEQAKQHQQSATSTISNNESRTMRSVETQTELLECSGDEEASSEDAASVVDDELEVIAPRQLESVTGRDHPSNSNAKEATDREEDDEDCDEDDILDEEDAKLKTIKRLNCSNLFNFNKLELLNERCSVGATQQQQISDSSRNLCDHEVHVAIDEELEAAAAAGEGKRTFEDKAGSSGAIIFIQESPEVIL